AAIVLSHPAHTPAALSVLVAAAWVSRSRRALACVTVACGAAVALVAFWLVPLLAHLAETRALAWGALARSSLTSPFTATLAALTLVAMARRWSPAFTAALHAVWLATLAVAIDALVLEPFGVRFLPADRVADGAFLLLLVASGLGAGVVVDAIGRRLPASAVAAAVIAGLVVFSLPGQRLALWPRAVDWPSY